jgi:hypothetical protein
MKRALLAIAAAAVSVALLAPLVATADHRPGHKPKEPNPDLSIKAEPDIQRWPKTVTISGRLRGQDRANKTIELRANPHPFSGPFGRVATTTTDANGDYTFTHRPDEHTRYRVVADLNPDETSGEVEVKSRMKVTRRVSDRTPSDGETITFSGRLGPAHPGHEVRIQRRRPSGTWKTMTSTPAGPAGPTNHSPYSTEVRINRDGVWRAKVRADENHRGNKSRRIRIDVQ